MTRVDQHDGNESAQSEALTGSGLDAVKVDGIVSYGSSFPVRDMPRKTRAPCFCLDIGLSDC
jgi:hypothetical protein